MTTTEIIPIFFSVDDRYAPYLAVALQSLRENASPAYRYHVHILAGGVNRQNKSRILAMQTENFIIEFVDVRERIFTLGGRLLLRDYYTVATYYRFFIPGLFPQYDRGVYLDCDIAVTGDVAELYHSDLGGRMLGAVTDDAVTGHEIFSRYVSAVLDVPPERYFNAGVLVMDLGKMRQRELFRAFLTLLGRRQFPVAQDQDYLNLLCAGDVRYLDGAWNRTAFPDAPGPAPRLIHYKMNFKPWHYRGVRFEEVFWRYAEQTAYASELLAEREAYSQEERERDARQAEGLLALAEAETEKAYRARAALSLLPA